MGVLSMINEGGSTNRKSVSRRDQIVSEGQQIHDEHYAGKWEGISNMFESDDEDSNFRAALTMQMVNRVENFIEHQKEMHGEAVVQQSLGTLNKRVLDVVRIFYPNQVALDLVDIQPIDGQVGEIFVMKPQYSQTLAGVTAGDEVFANHPTNNNYASEELYESLGTGDTSETNFTMTLANLPARPGTVQVYVNGVLVGSDDGAGNLVGATLTVSTIVYATGAVDVTFTAAPAAVPLVVRYLYSSESLETGIRQLEFDLSVVPVQARIHPLNLKYSVAAGLAASSHLAIDVQDTLAELTSQYIKVERDEKLIKLINANATADATLNFDADASSITIDKRSFYGDIELKIDQAESIIQNTNGRGGVDWVLCGRNAAGLFRNARGFRDEKPVAPIGAHRIGTLRDGTVAVIKSLTLGANEMIFGFKGYMAGDSATILAEWIPIYFTPVFQAPTLTNQQGVMSMYDLFVNNAGYYVKGTISNFAA